MISTRGVIPDLTLQWTGFSTKSCIIVDIAGSRIKGTRKRNENRALMATVPRNMDVLPIPDDVIAAVNAWGRRHQKEVKRNRIKFLNRVKQPYSWDNADLDDDQGKVIELFETDVPTVFSGS